MIMIDYLHERDAQFYDLLSFIIIIGQYILGISR